MGTPCEEASRPHLQGRHLEGSRLTEERGLCCRTRTSGEQGEPLNLRV